MTRTKAQTIWHNNASLSSLKSIELDPQLVNLVSSRYSMVSLGTERLVASGMIADAWHDMMKVPYMKGRLSLPCSYGYSLVGIDSSNQPVHLLHPHQDLCAVDSTYLFEIPEATPRYTLLSNMETAINIYWDATPAKSDQVLILGAGVIGLLTASVFRRAGHQVFLFDTDPIRKQWVDEMGFITTTPSRHSYPLIINTSGNSTALNMAIDLCTKEGTIVEASWYGKGKEPVNLGGKFHYNRLTIRSSQVGTIPAHKKDQWTFFKRKQLCLEYLKDDFYDIFVDKVISFDELPGEFETIRSGKYKYLSLIIKYF